MVPKIRRVEKTFICKKCFGKMLVRNIPEIDYKDMGISHNLYYNGWMKSCPHCGITYNKLGECEKDIFITRSVMLEVDRRVSYIVQFLNAVGCTTTGSCQGHLKHKYGSKEATITIPYISMNVDNTSKKICSMIDDIIADLNMGFWYIDRKIEFDAVSPALTIRAKPFAYSYIHTKAKFEEINSTVFHELAKLTDTLRERLPEDQRNKVDSVSKKLIVVDINKI